MVGIEFLALAGEVSATFARGISEPLTIRDYRIEHVTDHTQREG